MNRLTMEQLEAGLDEIRQSPKNEGALRLIVRRPQVGVREALEEGELNLAEGLVGDSWSSRGAHGAPGRPANRDMQLNVMNSRVIALVAQDKSRWQLAGDQLFIDLDLSTTNVPPGTRLAIGSTVIEVTARPHTGCKKFSASFGEEATRFVNSTEGKRLQLRGVNARVVQAGVIRVGDVVKKIAAASSEPHVSGATAES